MNHQGSSSAESSVLVGLQAWAGCLDRRRAKTPILAWQNCIFGRRHVFMIAESGLKMSSIKPHVCVHCKEHQNRLNALLCLDKVGNMIQKVFAAIPIDLFCPL